MDPKELLSALQVAERLKDTTRHCYTSQGRHESVAEHSWMMTLMALFLRDEFPELDMDKVLRMCVIHDLGEAFTGDIPTFEKNAAHEQTEQDLLHRWISSLPHPYREEFTQLYREMDLRESGEAKLYKAIDSLEALIQHNFSPLSTWLPLERELNLTYADDKVAFSPYLTAFREAVRQETVEKLKEDDA